MLAVKLMGGLGNQLFQYAFGRSLAITSGQEVRFETSFFLTNPHRSLDLRVLCPGLPIAEPRQVPRKARHYSYQTRLLDGLFPRMTEYYEQGRGFDKGVLTAAKVHSYFEGFWQSTRYFQPIEAQLRTEFQPAEALLAGPARKVLAQIESGPSVGIHIRRGDYVDNTVHQATYATCTPDYFTRGVAHIAGYVSDLRLFIFSDDPAWTRTHLRFPGHPVTYVQGHTSAEDFLLLKACDHQVIPNSTFSWWAGWLNDSPAKLVVMPRIWFRRPEHQATVPELVYEGVVTL